MEDLFAFRHGDYDRNSFELNNVGRNQAGFVASYILDFLKKPRGSKSNEYNYDAYNEKNGLFLLNSDAPRTKDFMDIIINSIYEDKDVNYMFKRKIHVQEPLISTSVEIIEPRIILERIASFQDLTHLGIFIGHSPFIEQLVEHYVQNESFKYDSAFNLQHDLEKGDGFHISYKTKTISFKAL